jgi:hypothetical protein
MNLLCLTDDAAARSDRELTGVAVCCSVFARVAPEQKLRDDNFSSIDVAVEEGRAVYGNLVKFVTWKRRTNLGEGLVRFFREPNGKSRDWQRYARRTGTPARQRGQTLASSAPLQLLLLRQRRGKATEFSLCWLR